MNTIFTSTITASLLMILFVIIPALVGIKRSCSRMRLHEFYHMDDSEGPIMMNSRMQWRAPTSAEIVRNSFEYEKSLQSPHYKRCLYALTLIFVINLYNVLLMDRWDHLDMLSKSLVSLTATLTILSILIMVYYQYQVMQREYHYQEADGAFAPTTNHFIRWHG